jgi:hypothetical protein
MKKLFLAFLTSLTLSGSALATEFQFGGDFVVPYRTDSPSGRLGMLAGGHLQAYISDALAADFTALYGVEDNGFADKPLYLIPGISVYLPTYVVQPYLSGNLPILANNGKDIGLQGAAGIQFGLSQGIALRYSVDVAYYFDAEAMIVNWVHAGLAVKF